MIKLSLQTSRTVQLMLLLLLCSTATALPAEEKPGSIDPTQSITYWKPFIIPATDNPQVAMAEQIFSVVLRSWDRSRVEPQLNIVKSTGGPWAASLADGNIILSQSALEICYRFGKQRAEHLIAFVLAHELAHQRADDLWHQKFLRIAERQTSEIRQQLFRGLKIDNESISDLAHREAQADHDGLLMMSSVGYDPYEVIGKKDFFTTWVEQIWQNPCPTGETGNTGDLQLESACDQARTRAMRTQTQLSSIAAQASLYQLGVHAFVGRNYAAAKRYFLAYGKNYPGRAVFKSLGITRLAQALDIYREIQPLLNTPDFYFPLMLDTSPAATPVAQQGRTTRSDTTAYLADKKQRMQRYTDEAINYFQRAIQIEPQHPDSYLYLAVSYLVSGNTYMSRGVLQGQFSPRFGPDVSADMFIAITSALEGNHKNAQQALDKLIGQAPSLLAATEKNTRDSGNSGLTSTTVVYSIFYNAAALASHQGDSKKAQQLWQQLAGLGNKTGHSLLFRLALSHINDTHLDSQNVSLLAQVEQLRPGDTFDLSTVQSVRGSITSHNSFWLDGEKFELVQFQSGARIITNNKNKVIDAWQTYADGARLGKLQPGDSIDRPYKVYGLPSRHLYMSSGEYLAYDHLGVAFHLLNNKLAGWFLYQPVH